MNPLVYLLRVADQEDLRAQVCAYLLVSTSPAWIRLSTLAPLSNHGYPETSEGELLALGEAGLVFGSSLDLAIPRAFVPWQNVAWLADGDLARAETEAQRRLLEPEATPET